MLNFLSESFGDSNKSHTFASAFENERNLNKTRLKSVRGKRMKKEFFEKIYIRQIK